MSDLPSFKEQELVAEVRKKVSPYYCSATYHNIVSIAVRETIKQLNIDPKTLKQKKVDTL